MITAFLFLLIHAGFLRIQLLSLPDRFQAEAVKFDLCCVCLQVLAWLLSWLRQTLIPLLVCIYLSVRRVHIFAVSD